MAWKQTKIKWLICYLARKSDFIIFCKYKKIWDVTDRNQRGLGIKFQILTSDYQIVYDNLWLRYKTAAGSLVPFTSLTMAYPWSSNNQNSLKENKFQDLERFFSNLNQDSGNFVA